MRAASEALLTAWESSAGHSHSEAAIRLLGNLGPDVLPLMVDSDGSRFGPKSAAALTIGERDGLLFDLRRSLFGDELALRTSCPECQDALELEASLDEFRRPAPHALPTTLAVDLDDVQFVVRFVLPTSHDLAVAMLADTAPARVSTLWDRCVRCERDGVAVSTADVPDWLVDQVEEAMSSADPQAIVDMELTCPSCAHSWYADFDIVSVLWTELDAHVRGLLADVSELAREFGWSEPQVLALTPRRRQFYLEQV